MNRLQRSLRATFTGMAVNFFLSLAKFVAGVVGHSHALIADAVESFADVFSSIIVWRGSVVAAKPADEEHPYGHGKAEPLAAAIVSGLMLAAAVWIATKAFDEITIPHPVPKPFTLLVLIVVVVIKESLFRFVRREAAVVDNPAVRADASHHRSDAITSFAAFIGISVSLVGGKGYEAADDWAAIAAACVIAWNGWKMLHPALRDLMDTAPNREVRIKIRGIAETIPGVARVEKCFVRKMGHQLYVDMHLEVDPQMTVLRSHEIAHDVKDKIQEIMPIVYDVLVHVEPLDIPAPQKMPEAGGRRIERE
ncbi:MAG TPA: cation diffusion facilitator family transporter [Candidatus Baltobacteraceae bacterium]|nr:cation diffusion facilitator family transporter [Candidatus Baltobacteraceae bacterium]